MQEFVVVVCEVCESCDGCEEISTLLITDRNLLIVVRLKNCS